ncbi:hypothetical protein [Phaeodactylibacter xiamenensis]|uniref:hypothetical protein n=1 Tax=Phaeodactylibacter xiamenensis TaxID=1524460 RepID=UPI003CCBB70B
MFRLYWLLIVPMIFIYQVGVSQRFSFDQHKSADSEFYKLVDQYFKGNVSFREIEKSAETGLYSSYNGKTVIYRVIDEVSEGKEKARQVFFLLANNDKFDLTRRYKTLPPPYTYLLERVSGFRNVDSTIIKAFFDRGVSSDGLDLSGNSLLILSAMYGVESLMKCAIEYGASLELKNNNGRNAFFFAVENDNLSQVKLLQEAGFGISLATLKGIDYHEIEHGVSHDLKLFFQESCIKEVNSFRTLKLFARFFPETRFNFLVSEDYIFNSLRLSNEDIPDFVKLMDVKGDSPSKYLELIEVLKLRYVNSVESVEGLSEAFQQFPIVSFKEYTADYYVSLSKTKRLAERITQLNEEKILSRKLSERLVKDILEKNRNFFDQVYHHGKDIGEYIALKEGFPEKAREIGEQCYERLIEGVYPVYSQMKWSENINSARAQLSGGGQRCRLYLANFEGSKYSETVKGKLRLINEYVEKYDRDYRFALAYEDDLDRQCYEITTKIYQRRTIPPYKQELISSEDGKRKYRVTFRDFPFSYSETVIEVEYDGNEYYVPSSFFLFSSKVFSSNTLKGTLTEFIFQRTGIDDPILGCPINTYRKKEQMIEGISLKGIDQWYTLPVFHDRF